MSDQIEIGDLVEVLFSTHPPIVGRVKHIPRATGDAWVLRIGDEPEDLVYVQQYDFMRIAQKVVREGAQDRRAS